MENLEIQTEDLYRIGIAKNKCPNLISITFADDAFIMSDMSINITLDQAKQIRDYLDNILKDR